MNAFLLALGLFAQDDLREKLDRRVTVEFRGGLTRGVNALQDLLGVPIELDPGVPDKIDIDREVALALKDVRAESALSWIAKLYGLLWFPRAGRIVLAFPEGVETRLLDGRGLMRAASPARVPRMDVVEGTGGVSVTLVEPEVDLLPCTVADLIRFAVEPGTWENECDIEILPDGRLVVTHLPAVVRRVEAFLDVLRRATPATVSVEAELFEATDEIAAYAGRDLGREEAAKIREAARKDARARVFAIPCFEGQNAYSMSVGQKISVRDVPDGALVTMYSEAAILSVVPAVSIDGQTIRLKLGLQAALSTPHAREMFGGRVDLPETSLVRFQTHLVLPNGGSTLLLLPRRERGSARPQALRIRAKVETRGPVDLTDPTDASTPALWAKLEAVAPMDLSIRDTRVEEAATFLRQSTGLNFVVDPQVDPHVKLAYQAKQVRLRAALEQLLATHGLELAAFAEAFYIVPAGVSGDLRTYVEPVRDLLCPPFEATVGTEELRAEFSIEDLAALIQAVVSKDEWDDDRTIWTTDGLLIVRQRPAVMAGVRTFLSRLRADTARRVRVRVDLLDVPVSAADLAPTLSADEVEKLIAASSSREHITLRGASGSRLGIDWTRQIVYVRDCNTDRGSPRVIDDTLSVPSTLTVRAHAGPEGADVEVDLRELTIDAIPSQKFGKIELQSPIVGTHHASTRFTVPRGKAVVVKLSGSREEGEERTVRLMLVRVAE